MKEKMTLLLAVIKTILPILSSRRSGILVLLLLILASQYFGGQYLLAQVGTQEVKIQSLAEHQVILIQTLKSIDSNISDVKESVKKTEERVWQMSRDVYMLKRNVQK